MHCKIAFCDAMAGTILSETKAKGMMISFLKHVEKGLSMLSCHLYEPLKHFHSLFLANQNYHKQVSNYHLSYYLSFVNSILSCILFCQYL